jgi:hypothetical protein
MKNGYSNDSLHLPKFQQTAPNHPFKPEERGCVDKAYAVLALPLPMDTLRIKVMSCHVIDDRLTD